MSRTISIDEIKGKLNSDSLSLAEALELADELVEHVDYWEKAERSSVKTLTKMLTDAREELDKSNRLITEYLQIAQRTDAMIEARDKKIENLQIKLDAYRESEN